MSDPFQHIEDDVRFDPVEKACRAALDILIPVRDRIVKEAPENQKRLARINAAIAELAYGS